MSSTWYAPTEEGGLRAERSARLRVAAPPRCHAFSADEQLLALGCVDAHLVVWNVARDSVTTCKANFVSRPSTNHQQPRWDCF